MAERILFGEFLVQKGHLDAATVLGLLMDQIRSQPAVADIVYQNNLLAETQQLEVLRLQSRTGWDYQQACVELNYWTDALAQEVVEKSAKARIPLGHLIVSRGIIKFGDLTKILDEFVGYCEGDGASATSSPRNPPKVSPVVIQETAGESISAPARVDPPTTVVVAPLAISESSFAVLDASLTTEYLEVFANDRETAVASLAASWAEKATSGGVQTLLPDLRMIAQELEGIFLASRFVRAVLLEHITQQGHALIERVCGNPESFSGKVEEMAAVVSSLYKVTWRLRGYVSSDRCEKGMWDNPDERLEYERVLEMIQSMS